MTKQGLYELVKAIQNGDEEKFESLLKRFEGKIQYSLSSVHQNDKDDFKQELYLKLYQKLKEYDLDHVPGFLEFREKMKKK